MRRKVFEGGAVAGLAVLLRVLIAMGGGYRLALGLTADRRIVGEWSPRMPLSFSPGALAKRFNSGVADLLGAATALPGFIIAGYRVPIPPASVARRGGPMRRPRRQAAGVNP